MNNHLTKALQQLANKNVGPIPLSFEERQALLESLPQEIIDSILPVVAGAYHDARGRITILTPAGKWLGVYGDPLNIELAAMPLTPLIPAPSRDEIWKSITNRIRSISFSDTRRLTDAQVDDLTDHVFRDLNANES